jgi:hypothetical protein
MSLRRLFAFLEVKTRNRDIAPIDPLPRSFRVADQPRTGFVCDHEGTYRNSAATHPRFSASCSSPINRMVSGEYINSILDKPSRMVGTDL